MTDALVATEPQLQQITRAIVDIARPVRVVLFGSRARGHAEPESDHDIMVEIDDADQRNDVLSATSRAMRENGWSVDLYIHGPGEFDTYRQHPYYVDYDIAREGRVLYRRPDAPALFALRGDTMSRGQHSARISCPMWARFGRQ